MHKGVERLGVSLTVEDVAHRLAIAQWIHRRLIEKRLGIALGVELVGDFVGGGQGWKFVSGSPEKRNHCFTYFIGSQGRQLAQSTTGEVVFCKLDSR